MFITNDFAAKDLACMMAMEAFANRLHQEEAHRQAIREGRIAAPDPSTWGTWNISDRH